MNKLDLTGQRFGKLTAQIATRAANGRTAWECLCDCGRTARVQTNKLRSGHTKSCGCQRNPSGPLHSKWKGGKPHKGSAGYVYVYAPDHPGNYGSRVLEHRLVMEGHLGRYLFDDENVHHKNGDRSDNRIENLEVWSTKQPLGQRVADKLRYAEEITARYRPRRVKVRRKVCA